MATRSTISVLNDDGSVKTVYCHWDGYLEGVGKTLLENYNTKEAADKLISGGAISSLGSYISENKESFDRPSDKDYTVYYSFRDEDLSVENYSSLEDYEENHQFEEFDYIFSDNMWSVFIASKQDWYDLEYELNIKQ
jgi:hypothetical protein